MIQSKDLTDPRNESFFSMIKNTLFPSFKCRSVTTLLVLINVLVYIILLIKGGIQPKHEFLAPRDDLLFHYGSNYPYFIYNSYEVHRLFVSLFLYKNIVHLILSNLGLLLVGHSLEETIGKRKFLAIFILSGGIGNLFGSCFWSKSSVGAAASIFGIIGALFGCICKNWKNTIMSQTLFSQIFYLFSLSILLSFILGIGLLRVNVYFYIGGFWVGLFMAFWGYVETTRTRYERKISVAGKIGFALFLISTILCFYLSGSPAAY